MWHPAVLIVEAIHLPRLKHTPLQPARLTDKILRQAVSPMHTAMLRIIQVRELGQAIALLVPIAMASRQLLGPLTTLDTTLPS